MISRKILLVAFILFIILGLLVLLPIRHAKMCEYAIDENFRKLDRVHFFWGCHRSQLYSALPGRGNPNFSWRVLVFNQISPDLGCNTGLLNFQEPWNSQHNLAVLRRPEFVNIFHLHFDIGWRLAPESDKTSVMAVIEKGTGSGDEIYLDYEYLEQMYKDNIDDLIVFVSVRNTDVHWAQPGDLSVEDFAGDKLPPKVGEGEFYVVFLDGEIRLLEGSTPTSAIRAFLTVDKAKKNDRNKILGPYTIRKRDAM